MDTQTNSHLTLKEYATVHGVSETTVRRRIRAGLLEAELRHGRYFIVDGEHETSQSEHEDSQPEQANGLSPAVVNQMQSEITHLRDQLASRDKQIDQLSHLLAMTTQQNGTLTKRLPQQRESWLSRLKARFSGEVEE